MPVEIRAAIPTNLQSFWYDLRAKIGWIDAVYLWADGSDPAFREKLARYRHLAGTHDPSVIGERRWRDNGELRFSLRSLETYAPWINRIFIVTPDGHAPAWMRRDHPRLRLVDQDLLFRNPEHVPSFNSAAIEANLHHLPGLSRRFLYFNDDCFIGRPITLRDFIDEKGRTRIRIEPEAMPDGEEGDLPFRWLSHNHRLLKAAFGPKDYALAAHPPQLYDLRVYRRVIAKWRGEFERTSASRFRTADGTSIHELYAHYLDARRRVSFRLRTAETHRFVMFQPPLDRTLAQLEEIRCARPAFFTINDDWDEEGCIKDEALTAFLADYFPVPSSFENVATPVRILRARVSSAPSPSVSIESTSGATANSIG
jgi:hypothetical protein